MMLAFGSWKVEQLDWRYDLPLNQPYLEFWYISFKKINSLAQLILRWHSWIDHVVTLFLTKAIGLPLPTIYRLMCSSGRGNVGSPMLCILLSKKLVLVKIVILHIPIVGKWIIKDGGKWIQHKCDGMWGTNHVLCFWKDMAFSGTPYFSWILPRNFWDLKLWSSLLLFSFACVQANFFIFYLFFYSIAPCLLSLKDFGGYV